MPSSDPQNVVSDVIPLDSIIREYLVRIDAGETIARDDFLQAHPAFREELQAFFEGAELVQRMAGIQPVSSDTATSAQHQTVEVSAKASEGARSTLAITTAIPEFAGPFPILFGQYRVLRRIGQGAMGAVYVADDLKLGRKVALKVPLPVVVAKAEYLDRFTREARASARLRHHNICPIYEVNELQGIHYIAMAFIEGKPLSDLLTQNRRFTGKQIAVTLRKIALALDVAHRAGVVHRDLKPANIMIDRDGEPIVMDFGLARNIDATDQVELTQEGMILGTPAYMSPEQVRSELHLIGPASDVYSLGVMLYELLCGRHPFRGPLMTLLMDVANESKVAPKPSEIRPTCDPQLESICSRMLSKGIAGRYSTMKEVAAALTTYLKSGQTAVEIPMVPAPETTPTTEPADTPAISANVPDRNADTITTPDGPVEPAAAPSSQQAIPLQTQSSGGGRKRSWRGRLAFGSLGAMILAGVIIITITTRDGTSTIEVPDTSIVEISRKPAATVPEKATKEPLSDGVPIAATSTAKTKASNATTAKTDVATGWHGWPADAPPPAIAPFEAEQARQHQEAWAKYLKVPVEYTNTIGMKFVLIPPGEFVMGSTSQEIDEALSQVDKSYPAGWDREIPTEAPQQKIVITHALYVGVHETRKIDYEHVLGATDRPAVKNTHEENLPANAVTWLDAARFCVKLCEKEKLPPFYFMDQHLRGTGYRLLTEAEWEYSCRAGTVTKYWNRDSTESLLESGWFAANSGSRQHEVGKLKANPFGLYDSVGNVWEWVQDGWNPDFYKEISDATAEDPIDVSPEFLLRGIRGGSFQSPAYQCRSATRTRERCDDPHNWFGFRVALTVDAVQRALDVKDAPNQPSKTLTLPRGNAIDFAHERSAAEHVVSSGGKVRLKSGGLIDAKDRLPILPLLIEEIWLNDVMVSDETCKKLEGLRNLNALHLDRAKFNAAALTKRLRSWPQLQVLSLKGSETAGQDLDVSDCIGLREFYAPPSLTDQQLQHVVKNCNVLKTVGLDGTPGITVTSLLTLRYLEHLSCGGDFLSEDAIRSLARIPSLKRLTWTSQINDEVADRISRLGPQLQSLEIAPSLDETSALTTAGYTALSQSLCLLELKIGGASGAPDKAGLMALASMPDLRSISIQTADVDGRLSAADIAEFRRLHPALTLSMPNETLLGLSAWPEGSDGSIAPWELPAESPPPAIAPFSPEEAKQHQATWGKHLQQEVEIENSIGMKFRFIPPGEFTYTHPERDQNGGRSSLSKRSIARLNKSYYVSVTEVSIAQFAEFVRETGYQTEAELGDGGNYISVVNNYGWNRVDRSISWKKPGPWVSKEQDPVSQVTWKDAAAFCKWLSKKEGVTYRLPTEMEWYHAFWAGSTLRWGITDDTNEMAKTTRFMNAVPQPHDETTSPVDVVDHGVANPYGLKGMIGNLWEYVFAGRGDVPFNGNQLHMSNNSDGVFALGGGWNMAIASYDGAWCGTQFSSFHSSTVGFRVLRQIEDETGSSYRPLSQPLLLRHGEPLSPKAMVSRPPQIAGLRSWSVEPKRRTENVTVIDHHPTQDLLATGGWDGAINFWTSTGELKQKLLGHGSTVISLNFFDQGQKLLTTGVAGEIRIWDVATGATLYSYVGEEKFPAALSPDEATLAVHVRHHNIALIDVATGVRQLREAAPGCLAVAWSPDGKLLASTGEDPSVYIWQVHPWKQLAKIPFEFKEHMYWVNDHANLAWSPDGKTIALNTPHSGKIFLFDGVKFETLEPLERPWNGGHRPAWSRDSRYLLVPSSWEHSGVFDITNRKLLFNLPAAEAMCWSIDQTKIYSTSGQCFDAKTGEQLAQVPATAEISERNTSLSPDGRFINSTDPTGQTEVWAADTGKLMARWGTVPFDLPPVWSPDGQTGITIVDDTIHVIHPLSGEVHRKIFAHQGGVLNAKFSPDGRWLATSGRSDHCLCLFDLATGVRRWKTETEKSAADHIVWSPDGRKLATCHKQSGEFRTWSAETGEALKSYSAARSKNPKSFAIQIQNTRTLDWGLDRPEIWTVEAPFNGLTLDLERGAIDEWGWHYYAHTDSSSFAPNRESQIWHGGHDFTRYRTRSSDPFQFSGQLGYASSWMPDSRRILLRYRPRTPYGYDLATQRRLGTLFPVIAPNVWLCIGPTGHFRGGFLDQPGAATDAQALSAAEASLVYVGQTLDGRQVTYSPREFAEKFGWKNDPDRATLLQFAGQR